MPGIPDASYGNMALEVLQYFQSSLVTSPVLCLGVKRRVRIGLC